MNLTGKGGRGRLRFGLVLSECLLSCQLGFSDLFLPSGGRSDTVSRDVRWDWDSSDLS